MTVQVSPVSMLFLNVSTQEPSQVVTDAIFPGNSPENQNDECVDTATGSSDAHDPIEENIEQDHSNTSAQSVASAKSFTRNMDIRYKVEYKIQKCLECRRSKWEQAVN